MRPSTACSIQERWQHTEHGDIAKPPPIKEPIAVGYLVAMLDKLTFLLSPLRPRLRQLRLQLFRPPNDLSQLVCSGILLLLASLARSR